MSEPHEIILGIDLGTTNSLVAVCDAAGPRLLRDEAGEGRVPSFLTFNPDGRTTVGWDAKQHAVEFPTSTVFSVKRLMGRGFEELEADGELAELPYQVVKRRTDESQRDIPAVTINGELLTPPQISAIILGELRERAERHLGRPVRKAVITVPAYFDDAQRQATRDAGRIAGLDVVRIVNEPTAAALAYGLGVRGQLSEGFEIAPNADRSAAAAATTANPLALAGACDTSKSNTTIARHTGPDGRQKPSVVAVYDLGGGTFDISILRLVGGVFEVLSTHGNTRLGGDDFDRSIIHLVQNEIRDQFKLDIASPATRQALRSLAESVKIKLSSEPESAIEIDLGQGRVYRRTLSRADFEAMLAPWLDKTIQSCRQALADARLKPCDIDQVILVGGSTRIPRVRQRVAEVFQREPYAALNPDEVVALGAAVQAGILAGVRKDALLLDVVPLSLGIETMGGAMGKLILRNTRIPCQATERFSTFVDGQVNVKINVLQGERELARDCRSLGEFVLRDIPPMPAGLPKLLVTFLIDENGILNVSAREERSGQEASIQIVPAHGLTSDEVRRMEQESFAHAREDMTAHRLIDLRNQVSFDTHKAEQMLDRVGDDLPAEERDRIEQAIAGLRERAETEQDADALHAALTAFDHGTLRLAELAIARTLRESTA